MSRKPDTLDSIAADVRNGIERGYYDVRRGAKHRPTSLRQAVARRRGRAIIAEVKFASPAHGRIRAASDPVAVAQQMVAGGAVALSVLTEPTHFAGHLTNLARIRPTVRVPLLMKDFIVAEVQLRAAERLGADAVLLIATLFRRHHCDLSLREMIRHAHDRGLEVLLEAYSRTEFEEALASEADVLGINNRDLRSMTVDLAKTERILRACPPHRRLVVSESGIETPEDIQRLRQAGAHGFLVGTSIMREADPQAAIRRLMKLA